MHSTVRVVAVDLLDETLYITYYMNVEHFWKNWQKLGFVR